MTEQVSLSSDVSTELRYHLNYLYILSMLDLRLDSLIFFLCAKQTRNHCVDVWLFTLPLLVNGIGIKSIN